MLQAELLYQPLEGTLDHAFDPSAPDFQSAVSPAWRFLFESLQRNSTDILPVWQNEVSRVSRNRGLAYHDQGFQVDVDAGWQLDAVPWIFGADEWSKLDQGAGQRLRLFEALFRDLYGDQRVLTEKWLPAGIIFGHPLFTPVLIERVRNGLRENGALPLGLGMSAMDVAFRAPGDPVALNDRFDCPFGLGLTVENRSVINRVLPRLFRRNRVRRIAGFFESWFEFLAESAPSKEDGVVLGVLTDEQVEASLADETGFLANYCGLMRLSPADLTVREGRVFLRALQGLVPVDVLWRMTQGAALDPLERAGALQGVGTAGSFEALRRGTIAIASHPGTGVLQSPSIYPFLRRICKELLGEDLIIPSVATWWCGQKEELSHVLENLSTMIIKPALHHKGRPALRGSLLSAAELEDLRQRILAAPHDFVGQVDLDITTVPTFAKHGTLQPEPVAMRMYGFMDREGQPSYLPGGLGRVSVGGKSLFSDQGGGISKDIWVRSDGGKGMDARSHEKQPSIQAIAERQLQAGALAVTPSRTAENLFWTGRYAERCYAVSRFTSRLMNGNTAAFNRSYEAERDHAFDLFQLLNHIFEQESSLPPECSIDDLLEQVFFHPQHGAGLPSNLRAMGFASSQVREEWSLISVRAINACTRPWLKVDGIPKGDGVRETMLEDLELNLTAFLGLNLDNMTRDEGWAMLEAGRRIERALLVLGGMSYLARSDMGSEASLQLAASFLVIFDSSRTYQTRYRSTPKFAHISELLLADERYPRSVMNMFRRIKTCVRMLPDSKPVKKRIYDTLQECKDSLAAVIAHIAEGEDASLELIARDLDALRDQVGQLFDEITVHYFSHSQPNF